MAGNLRITSTYVENTFKSLNSLSKKRDHLHIRGEYYGGRIRKQARSGSPPHTWRIQFAYIRRWSDDRITSTYVENTYLIKVGYFLVWDHLHIRGEYKTSASS